MNKLVRYSYSNMNIRLAYSNINEFVTLLLRDMVDYCLGIYDIRQRRWTNSTRAYNWHAQRVHDLMEV